MRQHLTLLRHSSQLMACTGGNVYTVRNQIHESLTVNHLAIPTPSTSHTFRMTIDCIKYLLSSSLRWVTDFDTLVIQRPVFMWGVYMMTTRIGITVKNWVV